MKPKYTLAIESSCDDTSAAILLNDKLLANIVGNQKIHEEYGGVVPELASREHQKNIVPVVAAALKEAGITKEQLDLVTYTQGPGLLGSLLVGASFAKSFGLALGLPTLGVNHMHGHILSPFIEDDSDRPKPSFPYLCLTVSGGHTQIVKVHSPVEMEILGETRDDAAGEAFDKAAKVMGLPYPGGPIIDKHAQGGDANRYTFPHPNIPGYDFSFSGLKTAFLYFIRDEVSFNKNFIEENIANICASYQAKIINILLAKLRRAALDHKIKDVAVVGGVSANSGLRKELQAIGEKHRLNTYTVPLAYCTDNAAMIGIAGYLQHNLGKTSGLDAVATARMAI